MKYNDTACIINIIFRLLSTSLLLCLFQLSFHIFWDKDCIPE